MVVEAGIAQDYKNKLLIVFKLLYKNKRINLTKMFEFELKIYNYIPFDVIKRGSLLVISFGLLFGCLCSVIEFITFLFIINEFIIMLPFPHDSINII